MPSSNAHPSRSRLAQESVKHFGVFASDLKEALAMSIVTNLTRYRHAAVLAITCSNDDIGVVSQTDQLFWIFETITQLCDEKIHAGTRAVRHSDFSEI